MFGKKQKLAEFLFDYLHKQGINKAFGLPGDFVLPAFRILDQSKIDIVTMTHEPAVGFAADCYARSHGLGMAIVTYCVGGLNMLNSIAGAYAEKSPVIVISGAPSPKDRVKDSMVHHKVKTFDTQKHIYDEVTCASTVLSDPDTAASEIVRVINEVKRQSRPGYIELPFDMVEAEIKIADNLFKENIEEISDDEVLEACTAEIVKKINEAERPVIVAGVELHRHGLTDLAASLAKEHNIPIAATLLGKSVVRENNPLYIGVYSGAFSEEACQKYINQSDCVVIIGAFISDVLLGFYSDKLDRQKTIIINADKIQIGMHSYDDILFKDVLKNLTSSGIKKRDMFENPNPAKIPGPLAEEKRDDQISVESLFDILSTHLKEDNTLICDTGDALVGAIGIRTEQRKHFFSNAYYLSMGFAAPATVGAAMADPESKIYTIIGDGAFQMTGMELSTIAKYKLSPVVIVINNDGYGTQRHVVDGNFNNIHMWDYTKITDMLGYGKSAKVRTKGQLDDALKEAADFNELYFIEIVVPKDECSPSLKRMGEALGKLRNKK